MPRLNIFENIPIGHLISSANLDSGLNGTFRMQGVVIPGSISFNTVAILLRATNTIGASLSCSFGLYSLNGSTLSLANSASAQVTASNASFFSWITLATSTTQDITPGNWYLGFINSTSGDDEWEIINISAVQLNQDGVYGGLFVMGASSDSRTNLPTSIATSALEKYGTSSTGATSTYAPYILITA